jgi:NAD(P)-dependent dehydrogenase (short-subunit alcohol dehydrogenase family)
MLAVYTASKAALEAFTHSLALELAPVGVRAHVVLPGSAPETAFGQNARAMMERHGVTVPEAYAAFAQGVFARMGAPRTGPVTRSADVVEAIWRAVTDPTTPVRLPAGADAAALAGEA